MKAAEKRLLFGLAGTITIICVVISMWAIKAEAKDRVLLKSINEREIEYRKELKSILKEAGCKNAGITMTKTCEDKTHLNYEVVINLPEYINSEGKAGLYEKLLAHDIGIEDSSVLICFSGKEE